MTNKSQYNLLTCISMIVGVVIGSGIFFKSDNILMATNGNIFLGVLAFCIAAISIIFGSLTLSELAARTDKPGGIVSYAEDAYGNGAACALGWFQLLLYYPTTIAVVCYVVGIYTCMLFGITATLKTQMIIGIIVALAIIVVNILTKQVATYFQTAATFIKLIPLFLIGIAGFLFGNPSSAVTVTSPELVSGSWLSALIPIVFAFDGWIVATGISHNVRNAKKNVPLALIISPLIILFMYLLYFVGMSVYLGPEAIMSSGDHHVELATASLLGPWAAKGILVFVIISVVATANGLATALFQVPYSLAIRNMFPASPKIVQINKKYNVPLYSYIIGGLIMFFWILVHYVTQAYNILPNSDISEIAVTLNYVLFIGLYYEVLRLAFKGEIKSFFKGKVTPILAILGSLIILYVGFQNKLFIVYVLICACILVSAYIYYHRKNGTVSETLPTED
ncbi:MAG: APC family permease [Cellulosilyticum sp.]|nr:APC family permease [Cellulosilyticum sp.]